MDIKGWRGIGHIERDCLTKKTEHSNPGTTNNSGVKKIDFRPYEESEDDFKLDQGTKITEINCNRQYSRVSMIQAGRIEQNRTG